MRDEFDEIDKMSEEELFDEMAKIMAEVHSDPNIKRPIITDDSRDYIFSEIRKIEEREARANLSDEDKRLLEYGRRYKRQLHRRKYWILAAVFVLVLAMGMTSVGGPQRFFDRFVRNLSGREQEMVDSIGDNIIPPENWDEEAAFEAIEEKFGFYPVRIDYLPEGVVFEGFELMNETQGARLFYSKENKLSIEMFVKVNYREGSVGLDLEDELIKEYQLEQGDILLDIKEYKVSKNGDMRICATFFEGQIYYCLISYDVDKEEFLEIIDNLVLYHN